MRRFRTTLPEPTLDLTPLLDVVFLLLTFFALTLVLLVRAELLDVRLPALGASDSPPTGQLITLAIQNDGELSLDGEPVALEDVAPRTAAALGLNEDAQLVLAIDVDAPSGRLIEVVQTLRAGGVERFGILGSRSETASAESAVPAEPAPPTPTPE